ncbi:pyridoxal phosphate-dependent transferase [Ilyonectria sp. MPI-CAGE-AT-0026]|nr:pyridoxal phosphate-dependent transferase [Ilyonectria sp. MPI-CAGE-AT-0026]
MTQKRCILPPSCRGVANLKSTPMMDLQQKKAEYPEYNPRDCPDGLIDISSATNILMLQEYKSWVDEHSVQLLDDLKSSADYGPSAGSAELRDAIAGLANRHFHPARSVDPASIIVGNGVASLLSTLTFSLCDAGEGIMLETPNYGMFESDVTYRNALHLEFVPTDHIPDRFSARGAQSLVRSYEKSLVAATKSGIKIRAVLICNPCNPVGRCYSRETVLALAEFSSRHGLHFVSDEIYALSAGLTTLNADSFTSVLTLPEMGGFEPRNVHVLSGAAKDFGLGGLRLGWLITRNELVWKAVRRLAPTTWVTSSSDRIFTRLLSNSTFIDDYLVKLREKLGEFRKDAIEALQIMGVPYEKGNAGLFLWIDLRKWLPGQSEEITNKLHNDVTGGSYNAAMQLGAYLMKNGVFLQPDIAFLTQGTGRFRLVYSGNSQEVFNLGMSRLKLALQGLSK